MATSCRFQVHPCMSYKYNMRIDWPVASTALAALYPKPRPGTPPGTRLSPYYKPWALMEPLSLQSSYAHYTYIHTYIYMYVYMYTWRPMLQTYDFLASLLSLPKYICSLSSVPARLCQEFLSSLSQRGSSGLVPSPTEPRLRGRVGSAIRQT